MKYVLIVCMVTGFIIITYGFFYKKRKKKSQSFCLLFNSLSFKSKTNVY